MDESTNVGSRSDRRPVKRGTLLAVLAILVSLGLSGCEVDDTGSGRNFLDRAERQEKKLRKRLARLKMERLEEAAKAKQKAKAAARAAYVQAQATVAPEPAPASDCDPNYEGACLDPNAYDYDCEGGSGDGPEYTGYVQVVGDDPHDLDSDSDGTGCE